MIDTATAQRYQEQHDKAALRRARYEQKHPDRKRGSGTPRAKQEDKLFIVWDGEGPRDAGYALLGNSEGMEICHPFLETEECLQLIIDTEVLYPDAIHVGFGFNYDVSNILRELSWRHFSALRKFNRTIWRGWEIEHIPHKWFSVKRGGVVARIFDVRSFFAGGLVSVLKEWKIGPWGDDDAYKDDRRIVERFKDARAEFLFEEIRDIAVYMRLELKYTKLLMETVRVAFRDAGYLPRSWHGPGALARMALRRHKVYDAMAETPEEVRLAAQFAFVGGRFELVKAGQVEGPVYVADINSAYPYFAQFLPNLARGKWRRTRTYEPGKFAVYRIRYCGTPDSYTIYPLFRRLPSGNVVWPYRAEGWYWAPEAGLVADDSAASFIDGWVFDEDDPTDKPFAWLSDYYRRRRILKDAGNPAQYTFKIIINAIYGQLAQRTGWDRKAYTGPKSHQLEWAGFITSACRASVFRVAKSAGRDLISIDTDGVTSKRHHTGLCNTKEFGGWELDEYTDGIFWQSGIYMLKSSKCAEKGCDNFKGDASKCGHEWSKARTRGIPKGSYTAEELLSAMDRNEPLRLTKKVFVTYGLAFQIGKHLLNTWQDEPHEFAFGGTGKRSHWTRACASACHGKLHSLAMSQLQFGPFVDMESARHYLPWLDTRERDTTDPKFVIDSYTLYDLNDLDEDEQWMKTYQKT
jgi:hypothetical protein